MKNSNKGSSILPMLWFLSAIAAIALIVSLLIINDQKDRKERRELQEAYEQSVVRNNNGASANKQSGTKSSEGTEVAGDNRNNPGGTGGAGNSDDGKITDSGEHDGNGEGMEEGHGETPTSEPTPTPEATPTPVSSEGRVPVDISGIDPLKPIVALSFDDGPGIYTQRVLDTLKKYNAHATFFMLGENAEKYPDAVKAVRAAGCEIGNHTVSHKDLKKLSASEILKEINDSQNTINNILGVSGEQYIVRPPYGNINDTVKETCKHPLILWSVDTLDWSSKNADKVLAEVKKEVKDGRVVLMHDIYQSTAEAVEKVVPWLVEQGYQICSVSEMYAVREEYMKDGHIYHYTYTVDEYKKNHGLSETADER